MTPASSIAPSADSCVGAAPLGLRASACRALSIGLALLALGPSAGCEMLSGNGSPDYSTSARENYERAVNESKKQNYTDAIKLFEYVKRKFGYTQYATLSELGIADCNFGREKYLDAVDGYRAFVKAHPTHPRVVDGYADFRVGESFFHEIPTEWFLVPPAYEKDMGPVRDALRELASFVVEFPRSPYLPKAIHLEEDCVRRLAEHEVYVADFYMRRKHGKAAVHRLEGLVRGDFLPKLATETGVATDRLSGVAKRFLKEKMEPEVLLLLGRTYMGMERPDLARSTFERLISDHPEDYHAKKAGLFLAQLGPLPPGSSPSVNPSEGAAPARKPGPAEAAPD